jgi:hypothetical protein
MIATLIWLVTLYSTLRPFSAELLLDRFPFVLTVANLALEYALMVLPEALPNLVGSLLGHSIYWIRSEGGWQWLNRWEIWVGSVFTWGFIIGGIWGLVNLTRGKSPILNAIAVVVTLLLLYMFTHIGL